MNYLTFDGVSLAYGLKPLLHDVSFQIKKGERVALIGRNGEGKSSLLKLINGDTKPDEGVIRIAKDCRIGCLPQDLPSAEDVTVFDVVASGNEKVGALLSEYHKLIESLDESSMGQLENIQHQIEVLDGWSFNQQIEQMLQRFQLSESSKMSSLSGGWRRRVLLAKALIAKPDILLLDEPTNHLDIAAIDWIETQLKLFQGGIIFVSHDREFIRKLSTRIIELDRGQLTSFDMNYDAYREMKEKLLEEEAQKNALFDKRLSDEEVWIRQGIKARRTRNEGRVRALKKLREERSARIDRVGKANFKIESASVSGKLVAELQGVSFGYEGNTEIIKDLDLLVMRGDKVGLLGKNGSGKTTLLKLILGKLTPTAGNLKTGTQLKVAYFDQLRDALDPEKTVMDNLSEGREFIELNGKDRHVISYLNDFLFTSERSRTPVKALSGGETNRLLLAKLFSKAANILVLDEPTNDLDVETLELLESLVDGFEGTVLVTSHDRMFLDNVVTSTLVFEGSGKISEYVGGYTDWIRQGGDFQRLLAELPVSGGLVSDNMDVKKPENVGRDEIKPIKSSRKLSYKEQRELEALPGQIEALEQQIEALQAKIAAPEFYQHPHDEVASILQDLEIKESEMNLAVERWVELDAD
jgi:ATP-binding cassette subfamily F protein uup